MSTSSDRLFLGLDSSTQSLKATLIDERLTVVAEQQVQFDADLPEFSTQGGVQRGADGLTVTSPTIMWVAAMDVLMAKMRDARWPFGRIAAVSGSGQQHGSVWFARGAEECLRKLDPSKSLREQMAHAFAVADSPVWMDSSTSAECRALEDALGGAQAVAELTGSRAYERFTGNQIAKIFRKKRSGYDATERISLVSSFAASLLVGRYASIDAADGAGMNLMDIRTRKWDARAMKATAEDLERRLGDIGQSHAVAGTIHGYYVKKYGFDPKCVVILFSGDNPCSLAGLRLEKSGDIAVSLGTSDTVFGSLSEPSPSASEGHIFANPVDPAGYMALVCYKNGSLTREHVRDISANKSWETFNRMLRETEVGNGGRIAFFIKEPEITPPILKTGISRFDERGRKVEKFDGAADVRAVLEGQFLSMRLHGAAIGLRPKQILATGGASANTAVLGIMANVLGAPVFVAEQTGSASLGAAYRAVHGWRCREAGRFISFAEVMSGAPPFRLAARPDAAAHGIYTGMLERFAELERRVVRG